MVSKLYFGIISASLSARCDALFAASLGRITVFPGDDAYDESRNTFYSQGNHNLELNCNVQPTTIKKVSQVIKILGSSSDLTNWDIGVRSGGHSDWNNNAVYRGVSIDLSKFNQVELTTYSGIPWKQAIEWTGRSAITDVVARIRPATHWGDVITYLEPYGVSVTGGRSGHVGVGGLLVAGGASYNIQQWRLSCDNVVNYEVVLANGNVVQANRFVNGDLFKVLKGGGNNLGIVTRFDMRTFTVPPQGAYGGLAFSPFSSIDANIDSGPPGHQFLVYRYDGPKGGYGLMNMMVSTDGKNNSSNFADFGSKIPLSIVQSISDAGGSYYHSATLSIQPSEAMLQKSAEILQTLVDAAQKAGSTATFNFVHQPLPKMLASVNPGGNILGLDQTLRTNQVLFEARATTPAADGAAKNAIMDSLLLKAVEELRQFSASQPNHSTYVYMNYASPTQNVLESYGASNVAYLRRVAGKYDPTGFFQTRVPGGWKIGRF
ncbi:FAD-binding domain-containing protein [Bimuria novae-zelandiae CBS 107.79]|uniref:FAD-binding domain-containing protein n=1 Tax=Bimuria novae-zelandiae CBS 107.79 TaxID=1447943 RepID=A0A6A5US94_9PLEO|nr:FAD-binding domain-containing protein [Bimuria novae-zelandiae CBS 107.79]